MRILNYILTGSFMVLALLFVASCDDDSGSGGNSCPDLTALETKLTTFNDTNVATECAAKETAANDFVDSYDDLTAQQIAACGTDLATLTAGYTAAKTWLETNDGKPCELKTTATASL